MEVNTLKTPYATRLFIVFYWLYRLKRHITIKCCCLNYYKYFNFYYFLIFFRKVHCNVNLIFLAIYTRLHSGTEKRHTLVFFWTFIMRKPIKIFSFSQTIFYRFYARTIACWQRIVSISLNISSWDVSLLYPLRRRFLIHFDKWNLFWYSILLRKFCFVSPI